MAKHPFACAVLAGTFLLLTASTQGQTFTWGPVQNIPFSARQVFGSISPMDMNGDGKTDICLTLWNFDSQGAVFFFKYIYVGDGLGHFASTPVLVHESTSNYGAATVQFFDVNGDGFSDEVYSFAGFTLNGVSYPGAFAVLLGDGKGNLTQTTSIPQPLSAVIGSGDSILAPNTLAAASFRNNGKLDFVTVFPDPAKPAHSVFTTYLNDGAGMFHVGISTEVSSSVPLSPTAGDFDGDGHIDIAWPDNSPQPNTNNRFAIHCAYGNGDGTFAQEKLCYTLDGPPFGLMAANLNGDRKADLIVFTGPKVGATGARPRLATLLARQTGGFYWSSSVSAPGIPVDFIYGMPLLALQDLNGDGYQDVILAGEYLFAGRGSGIFAAPQALGFPGNFDVPAFAPLEKGGLPALFYSANDDGDFSTKFSWQLNTSPK